MLMASSLIPAGVEKVELARLLVLKGHMIVRDRMAGENPCAGGYLRCIHPLLGTRRSEPRAPKYGDDLATGLEIMV